MTEQPRRRYRIRLRAAFAGSVLAAATAASLTGFTASPALAVPPRAVSASSTLADDDAVLGPAPAPLLDGVPSAGSSSEALSPGQRLAGVRADLDRAVLLRMVTLDQADAFYLQIERRVAAGL